MRTASGARKHVRILAIRAQSERVLDSTLMSVLFSKTNPFVSAQNVSDDKDSRMGDRLSAEVRGKLGCLDV